MTNRRSDVLVVEDDPDLVEIVRLMLDTLGYDVRCTRNGREAIAAVAQKKPAVVLLDMLMPVMDGWECARELRARYGHTVPIVVMTAAEHAGVRADQVGAVDVLSKPFDIDHLLSVIARYAPTHSSDTTSSAAPPDNQ
jgi:CheY-like chemotaxis protein